MQYSQEHLKTMVYAKFGGQTECIMGNWKIENEWVSTSQIDNLWEFIKAVSSYTVDQNGLLCAFIF